MRRTVTVVFVNNGLQDYVTYSGEGIQACVDCGCLHVVDESTTPMEVKAMFNAGCWSHVFVETGED